MTTKVRPARRRQAAAIAEPVHRLGSAATSGTDAGLATEVILTVVLACTPLLLLNGIFLSHDVIPKVIAALTGAALLLFLLPQWRGGIDNLWKSPAGRAFLLLVAAQCISLAMSTAASGQPGLSLTGTTWRRFGAAEQIAILVIAVAAAAMSTLHKGWTIRLFRAVSLGGGLASVYGILQYLGVDPFLDTALYKLEYFGGIIRPPATMGHAIYFAAWLVPVTLIAASSARSETATRWKVLHAVTSAIASVAIFLSGSRGAVLAVLLAGVFLTLRSGGPGARRFRLQIAGAGTAVVLAISVLALSPAGAGIRQRVIQWREDPGGPRLGMWRESPALIGAHPLLGAGPDTFAGEFRKIESEALSRAYPDFYNETPHNALIDAACGQGIPGALILAGVFLLGAFLRSRGELAGQSMVAGIEAAVFGIFVSSLFASFTIVESMILWSLTGIGIALSITSVKPVNAKPAQAPVSGFWLVQATLLAAAFLLTATILSVPDAAYSGLADAVARKDPARADRIYTTASQWSFGLPLPGYELFASRQFAILGRSLAGTPDAARAWGRASEAAARAERGSEERFSAAYQSSVLAISTGDLKRGETKARDAIELAPNWYRPHFFLSQILEATGRAKEGAAERQRSVQLGAKSQ